MRESFCTFLKWASMSGLLSHISVRRTTDVWRTPGGKDKLGGHWFVESSTSSNSDLKMQGIVMVGVIN